MRLAFIIVFLFQSFLSFSQRNDSSQYVIIDHDKEGNIIKCSDITKRHIYRDFQLTKDNPTIYSISITEDSTSFLFINKNNGRRIIDVIDNSLSLYSDHSCNIEFPYFEKTDFNQDGYVDLIVPLQTNINGNMWTKIYLYNPTSQELQLINSSEDTTMYWINGIWAAPEFNPKDSTINCNHLSGVYGLTYTSKYKLIGTEVIPLEKEEDDARAVDENGKGEIHRRYIGKNGKWIIIDTKID